MSAALRIVFGVVAYRLRKLEMANLAAAVSIAVALSGSIAGAFVSIPNLAARTVFAFLLNALVYLNNDYIDVRIDLESADKDASKSRFLADNMGAALGAQLLMVASLAAFAFVYDVGLLVPLIAGGGICWWYSAQLKHRPYWDITAMILWGITMPMCGSPASSLLGWALALQLGLFSGVFESIQVMRDADDDAASGVRTTGVVLGKKKTLLLARVLMVASSAYAAAVMHPIAAAITALALLVPCDDARIERYWTRVKMVYGVAWLFIIGWLLFEPKTAGLLRSVDHAVGF